MLQIGIIGCGRVTSMFNLKAIHQLENIDIVAVADVNENRMNEIKKSGSASFGYLDYRQLLEADDVEAVVINTPPTFHEEMVLDALEAGKHVLCEKPLSASIEGCLRVKELKNKSGLVVLPLHNYAFTPSLTQMKNYIQANSVGNIRKIEVIFENLLKSYRSHTDFRENAKEGIVGDVLPHILSVVYPLVGHVERVGLINSWCKEYDVCDNLVAELFANNDVLINSAMSWTKIRPRFSVSVDGEKGNLYTDLMINPYKLDITMQGKTTTWKDKGVGWYLDMVQFKHPSFKNQYEHFYHLVKEGGDPMITVEDEINMIETKTKILEKMS